MVQYKSSCYLRRHIFKTKLYIVPKITSKRPQMRLHSFVIEISRQHSTIKLVYEIIFFATRKQTRHTCIIKTSRRLQGCPLLSTSLRYPQTFCVHCKYHSFAVRASFRDIVQSSSLPRSPRGPINLCVGASSQWFIHLAINQSHL